MSRDAKEVATAAEINARSGLPSIGTDIQAFMEVATAVEMKRRGALSNTYERLKAWQAGLHNSKISVNPSILLVMSSVTYIGRVHGSRFSRGS